jgi:Glycosyl hydrolase family 3 C-terminal domain
VHSVGPLILEPWIDHPNVTAVVWAGLGGSETGNSLVDILYGDVNPSGRLPYTIAKSSSDYPAQLTTGGSGNEILNITYSEGCVHPQVDLPTQISLTNFYFIFVFPRRLFIDYRYFDAKHITPRYEFGFGLSYATFEYSDLSINPVEGGQDHDSQLEANWAAGNPGLQVVGASTALWLHRPAFNVSFRVQNTGRVAGTEVRRLSCTYVLCRFDVLKWGIPADSTGVLTLPCSRWRASICPSRLHRRGAAAGRITDRHDHPL